MWTQIAVATGVIAVTVIYYWVTRRPSPAVVQAVAAKYDDL